MHSTTASGLHIDFSALGHTSILHQKPFKMEGRSICIKVSGEIIQQFKSVEV